MKHDLFEIAGWALLIFLFGTLIVMGGCSPIELPAVYACGK